MVPSYLNAKYSVYEKLQNILQTFLFAKQREPDPDHLKITAKMMDILQFGDDFDSLNR